MNPFNKCLLKFLEIFLGDLTVTNKKFQEERGDLTRIRFIMEDLLRRFSNILLLEDFRNLPISERLQIINFSKNNKKATFSNKFKKNGSQLMKYFLERYSEDTNINNLKKDDQIKIVANMEIFITNILCRIKKYFPFHDQIFSIIVTLNPVLFKKEKWLTLNKTVQTVLFIIIDKHGLFLKHLYIF